MKKNKTVNTVQRGPGRPAYQPKFPKSKKFTMADFCVANGIDPKTGKGPNCTKLTLDKFRKANLGQRNSILVLVKDELREPASQNGLGRKCFVYSLRSRVTAGEKTVAVAKSAKGKSSKGTFTYEAKKAALLASTPSVAVPANVPEPTQDPVAAPLIDQAPSPVAEVGEVQPA